MVLTPSSIINDLKVLETDGIKGPLFKDAVHGSIVQVTGDNLGIHGLFGFVESFSARNCCRFCIIEKSEFQTVFCEDDQSVILRTKYMLAEHCHTVQTNPQLPHVYGVKRSCLLNNLQYFNTADNLSVDFMHDILEGVAQLEVKLVLEYFQENLTAKKLTSRIESFNYGYTEKSNRPPAVKLLDGGNDLGLNAIQSWCLLRNMMFASVNVVAADSKYCVFSHPNNWHDHLSEAHHHHQLLKRLFRTRNLLSKHHFMIHYPRCIRNIGPLLHMWCMRYESKHNFFKTQLHPSIHYLPLLKVCNILVQS